MAMAATGENRASEADTDLNFSELLIKPASVMRLNDVYGTSSEAHW